MISLSLARLGQTPAHKCDPETKLRCDCRVALAYFNVTEQVSTLRSSCRCFAGCAMKLTSGQRSAKNLNLLWKSRIYNCDSSSKVGESSTLLAGRAHIETLRLNLRVGARTG